jgi:hypothetical protein
MYCTKPVEHIPPAVGDVVVSGTHVKESAATCMIPYWVMLSQSTEDAVKANVVASSHVERTKVGKEVWHIAVRTFTNPEAIDKGTRLLRLIDCIQKAIDNSVAEPRERCRNSRARREAAKGVGKNGATGRAGK